MSGRTFKAKLDSACGRFGHVCVGLDPDPSEIERATGNMAWQPTAAEYCRVVIESTVGVAASYKFNSAFFEQLGPEGMFELEATIEFCRDASPDSILVLDAKRGDIGNTSKAYASAAFERYGVDAVTVNPYMGWESVSPFVSDPSKGAYVLCRTSNPGSALLQELVVDGDPIYRRVAREVSGGWNGNHNCGLVVGATYPGELADVVSVAPHVPLLIPGVGAQGDSIQDTLSAVTGSSTFLINSSRGIMYPTAGASTRKELSTEMSEAADRLHRQLTSV